MNTDFSHRRVTCNGTPVDTSPERFGPLRESTLADPAELRARLATDGYVFLRGVLPVDQVRDCRARVLAVHAEALLPGTDGVAREPLPGGVLTAERLLQANRLPCYPALCHSASVVGVHEALLGGLIHLHRRKIIRLLPPGGRVGDVHQDLCYLQEGTDRVLTSWIPLGDTPLEVGGLMVLDGSHVHGPLPHCRHMPPPSVVQDELGGLWRSADYRAGDMIVFSSTLVHTGLDNTDTEQRRLRLSSDTRYQLASDPLDARWQNEWHPRDGL